MRKRATVILLVSNTVLIVLMICQNMILIPLYLSHIGEYLYGIWLALASTVALIGFVDLGINGLVSQRAAVYYGAKDYKSLGSLLGTITLSFIFFIIFIGIIGFSLAPRLPGWFGVEGKYISQLATGVRVSIVDIILMITVSMMGSYLLGLQKPDAHVLGQIGGTIAAITVTIVLLFKGYGVLAIPFGSIIRPLINLPVDIVALLINLWKINVLKKICFKWIMLKDFFRSALWLCPAKTAQALTAQIDYIVVIKILNPIDVTILNITRKASELIVQVAGRLSASFLSGLAHLHGAGEKDKFRLIVILLMRVVFYSAGIGFGGFLLLNKDFVYIWTNSTVYGGQILTYLLFVYGFIKLFRITFYNIIFARGKIALSSTASIVESVLQVVLGIVFCRMWGIKGIVMAGIVAVTSGFSILGLGFMRQMNFSWKKIFNEFIKTLPFILLPLVFGFCFHLFWKPSDWIELLLFSAGYLTVAVISFFIGEPQLRSYIFNELLIKFKVLRKSIL